MILTTVHTGRPSALRQSGKPLSLSLTVKTSSSFSPPQLSLSLSYSCLTWFVSMYQLYGRLSNLPVSPSSIKCTFCSLLFSCDWSIRSVCGHARWSIPLLLPSSTSDPSLVANEIEMQLRTLTSQHREVNIFYYVRK